MKVQKTKAKYDDFIKQALKAGFTDDQVNFLQNWIWDELYENEEDY